MTNRTDGRRSVPPCRVTAAHIASLVGLAIAATTAQAQGWSAGPPLGAARAGAVAAALPDGRVWISGGVNASAYPVDIQIYATATNTWTTTNWPYSMAQLATITLLNNNHSLLIAGGYANGAKDYAFYCGLNPPNCQLYAGYQLLAARYNHTATLLADGSVLLAGGTDGTNELASVEKWNIFNNGSHAAAPMHVARMRPTATLLPDGRVFVAGGSQNNIGLTSTEIYDPATDSWSIAAPMAHGHATHSATLLPNGRVLIAGGRAGAIAADCEVYNPATNTWSNTGSLIAAREGHTATLLPDGEVLVAGGNNAAAELASVEIYSPALGQWRSAPAMSQARAYHSASLMTNGRVLITGGYTSPPDAYYATTEIYDPAVPIWTTVSTMSTPREYHAATLLPSGKVLIAGGIDGGAIPLATSELYNPQGQGFEGLASMQATHDHPRATLLADGSVLLTGDATPERYDSAANAWRVVPPAPDVHASSSATLLHDGRVLVAGGDDGSGASIASTVFFNFERNAWTPGPTMNHVRDSHSATLFGSGCVVVAGGHEIGVGDLTSSEYWCPGDAAWTNAGDLTSPRSGHYATLLPNGSVLVTGTPSNVFDPVTHTWSALTNGVAHVPLARLWNGTVLAIDDDSTPYAQTLLPGATAWTAYVAPTLSRKNYTLTRLADGKMLLAGGWSHQAPPFSNILDWGDVLDPTLQSLGASPRAIVTGVTPLETYTYGTVTGSGFLPPQEANGGWAGNAAATNRPSVQLTAIESGESRWVDLSPLSGGLTDTSFSMDYDAVNGFPLGPLFLNMYVNGTPSVAYLTTVAPNAIFGNGFEP